MGQLSLLSGVVALWAVTISSNLGVEGFSTTISLQGRQHGIVKLQPRGIPKLAALGTSGGSGGMTSSSLVLSSNGDASSTSTSSSSSASSSSSTSTGKSLLFSLDQFGESFKPKAEKSTAKAYQADSNGQKIRYQIQTCVCYIVFMIYLAIRGGITIVPSIFRNVYQRFTSTLDIFDSILHVQDFTTTVSASKSAGTSTEDDDEGVEATTTNSTAVATSKKDTILWTTKATSAVLASVLTLSYVVGGAVRVGRKFVSKLSKTSSLPQSFEIAADEMIQNEERLDRLFQSIQESLSVSSSEEAVVNGEDGIDVSSSAVDEDDADADGNESI